MSNRGSFVTEYIYCDKCFKVVKKVLLSKNKYLCSEVIKSWEKGKGELPIVAGKIGESYLGGELVYFEFELMPEIEKKICHPLRVSVLAEGGQRTFRLKPIKKRKKK